MRASSASALAMSVVGVALLWPTMAAAQDRPAQDHPAMVGGRPVPARSGRLALARLRLRREDHGRRAHAVSRRRQLLLFGPAAGARPGQPVQALSAARARRRSRSTPIAGRPRIVFDRLPDLPAACAIRRHGRGLASSPWWRRPSPTSIPSFELRGIDWRARTAAAERAIDENSDDAALFETLRTMLAGVEDPHVELRAEVAGEPRSFDARQWTHAHAHPRGIRRRDCG